VTVTVADENEESSPEHRPTRGVADEMVSEGMPTLERVHIVSYRSSAD
jgi:hypothetical protein